MRHPTTDKFTMMTTGSVKRLILSLAAPSMVINVISAFYNMADTFFVGSLGTSQVAAVGVAFPLQAVIQAFGFLFGQGSANYMSRALGAKDTDGAESMAITALISGVAIAAVIGVVGMLFRNPLVMLLGSTPTIRPYAASYIFYILIAAPFMVGSTVINQQLRFQGSANIAMAGMVSGAVLNIFLDPLFIFGFKLGVQGAAIATMLSQMTSFAILFFYGATRPGNIHFKLARFNPKPSRYLEMFRGGIPSLLRQGLNSVTTIMVNHFAKIYCGAFPPDAAIAAISIVNRTAQFTNSLMLGFGQGFQPVCGFNYGAKKYGRVKEGYWFCVKWVFIFLAAACVLLALFAPQVIAVFRRDDPQVIQIGALALRFQCMSLPFTSFCVMTNMMTQTMGQAGYASLIALARRGLFLLPAMLIMAPFIGLNGILLATPVGEFCAVIMSIPISSHVRKTLLHTPAEIR